MTFLEIQFQVGYDDTFKNDFSNDNEINLYLDQVVTHVQTHYCHYESLGTKVKVEVNSAA